MMLRANCGALPPPSPDRPERRRRAAPAGPRRRLPGAHRRNRAASFLPLPAVRLEPRAPCVHVWRPRPHRGAGGRPPLTAPTADAISGKPNPNTSFSTKTARSSGLSRSSSNRAAHRQRVGQLRRALRVLVGVGEQRLGEPWPGVLLPPDAGRGASTSIEIRVTTAEREGLGRRGVVSGRPGSAARFSWSASSAVAHAAEDPVGDSRTAAARSCSNSSVPGHAQLFLEALAP